jgi:hypothetical protein
MRVMGSGAIVGIHAVTSANALHHAYLAAATPESRLLVLLQAAGWMTQFRTWAEEREKSLRTLSITELVPHSDATDTDAVLSRPASEADQTASQMLRLARDPSARQKFLAGALRTTIPKADEVHYYKYLAALIEDIPLVSAEWQPHLTAASLYYMKRGDDREPASMTRARKALLSLAA